MRLYRLIGYNCLQFVSRNSWSIRVALYFITMMSPQILFRYQYFQLKCMYESGTVLQCTKVQKLWWHLLITSAFFASSGGLLVDKFKQTVMASFNKISYSVWVLYIIAQLAHRWSYSKVSTMYMHTLTDLNLPIWMIHVISYNYEIV